MMDTQPQLLGEAPSLSLKEFKAKKKKKPHTLPKLLCSEGRYDGGRAEAGHRDLLQMCGQC